MNNIVIIRRSGQYQGPAAACPQTKATAEYCLVYSDPDL